jgi:outer membrane receptor protein involved in Fe transport
VEIELRNTAIYSDVEIERRTDPGNGNADILADEFSNKTYSNTLRLREVCAVLSAPIVSPRKPTRRSTWGGTFDDETQTAAIFGEGTITFFDKLDFTLSARYEREKRERAGSLGAFVIDLDETLVHFCPSSASLTVPATGLGSKLRHRGTG